MGKSAQSSANSALKSQGSVAQSIGNLANTQASMSQGLWDQTAPSRALATNTYMGLAQGNTPGIQKYVAPQINAATQNYDMARKSIEGMAPGGGRDAALRNLTVQQAGAKNQIYSGGVADALSKVSSLGYSGAGTALGGFGQAQQGLMGSANALGNTAQGYNTMASQKGAATGAGVQGLGAAASMAFK